MLAAIPQGSFSSKPAEPGSPPDPHTSKRIKGYVAPIAS